MPKIPKWIPIIFSTCGGWWSAMSGAVSIPLAVLALIFGGPPATWLATLAFVGLWVFAIGVVIKNYQMAAALKTAEENHSQNIKRLESEIQALKDDTKKRNDQDVSLSLCLQLIRGRLGEARKINSFSFHDDVKSEQWEKTHKIVSFIESELTKYFGRTESEKFTGAVVQPVESADLVTYVLRESVLDYRWHINVLNAKRDALMQLSEKLKQ